jgi:hypothetical protein
MSVNRKKTSFQDWLYDVMNSPNRQNVEAIDLEFVEDQIIIDSNSSFLFKNCKFNNLILNNAHNFKLYDESECNNISMANGNIELFQFFNSTVLRDLNIITSSGQIALDNSVINNLFLHPNFGRFHSLIVNLCTFENLTLNRFLPHQNETVKFELCTVNKRMNIDYSILDNVGFNGFNLNEAELKILNSSIIKANYYSITWPTSFRVIEGIDGRGLSKLAVGDVIKLQEIYRQLKTISLDGTNKVEAKKFLKNEMRVYHQQINLQRNAMPLKSFLAYISLLADSAMLGINKVFTDYGESIIRPVGGLIFFGFLFFCFWMQPLGIQFEFNIDLIDWIITKQAYGYFFNFLSPVHSYDVTNVNNCTVKLFGISDFLMRLISGFLIYHIIRATRKFNFSV